MRQIGMYNICMHGVCMSERGIRSAATSVTDSCEHHVGLGTQPETAASALNQGHLSSPLLLLFVLCDFKSLSLSESWF